ncbi:MAG: pyruvate, phosphate dikinase, partial [Planctomycetes bacterium]|nr:pyruvate, phosphate dikinase [Planctomycetota bacterium]
MAPQDVEFIAHAPEDIAALLAEVRRLKDSAADQLEVAFGESFNLEVTVSQGETHILEVRPARRSARAAVRIAVELAERGAISREEALLRV